MPEQATHKYADATITFRGNHRTAVVMKVEGAGIDEPWLFGWPDHAAFQRFVDTAQHFAAELAREDESNG